METSKITTASGLVVWCNLTTRTIEELRIIKSNESYHKGVENNASKKTAIKDTSN